MSSKTAVVLLNWNGIHLLKQFLPEVIACSPGASIVVADNASSDGSVAMLKSDFPDVRIIEIASNKGFTGGYNEALQQIDAEFYVLLNTDVQVTPGWIEPMETLFDEDPKIGAIQPKIRAFKQRTHFEYAGASGGYLDRLGFPFCRGRIFESNSDKTILRPGDSINGLTLNKILESFQYSLDFEVLSIIEKVSNE